jgi:hypothetical protein
MTEETTYTFKQILDRLLLTDEEVLLCKQHREYAEKLDYLLDARDFRIDVDSIGNIEEKPTDMWSWYREGGYYGA